MIAAITTTTDNLPGIKLIEARVSTGNLLL